MLKWDKAFPLKLKYGSGYILLLLGQNIYFVGYRGNISPNSLFIDNLS